MGKRGTGCSVHDEMRAGLLYPGGQDLENDVTRLVENRGNPHHTYRQEPSGEIVGANPHD